MKFNIPSLRANEVSAAIHLPDAQRLTGDGSLHRLRLLAMTLVCFCAFSNAIAHAADAPRFFSTLQDVPLAPGLDELSDQGVEFDKPEGRIVESVAVAEDGASEDSIRAFYDETLPQLGWTKTGAGAFTREKERMTMNFEGEKGHMYLRVNVSPAN